MGFMEYYKRYKCHIMVFPPYNTHDTGLIISCNMRRNYHYEKKLEMAFNMGNNRPDYCSCRNYNTRSY